MYEIDFDLDSDTLQILYKNHSYKNAYYDIKNTLEGYGFTRQQGSVYFRKEGVVNAVTCATAIMGLTQTYDWFATSVKDIRMLRIEDNNDLRPVIESTIKMTKTRD